jgi:hypothetical protein
MHGKDVPVTAMQPGEDQDLVARPQISRRLTYGFVEEQLGLGSALVTLMWRLGQVNE